MSVCLSVCMYAHMYTMYKCMHLYVLKIMCVYVNMYAHFMYHSVYIYICTNTERDMNDSLYDPS